MKWWLLTKETTIKGKIGIPYVKTIVSVFDSETLEEKSYKEEGEICIQSHTLMIGYYHEEQLTIEVLRKHDDGFIWIHRGDLGIIDEKRFITITGRIISIYTGEKIYPVQLESIIAKVLGVIKVSVIKAPDKYHEEYYVPVAWVVIDKGYNSEQVRKNIILTCEELLPDYAWQPKIIIKDVFLFS